MSDLFLRPKRASMIGMHCLSWFKEFKGWTSVRTLLTTLSLSTALSLPWLYLPQTPSIISMEMSWGTCRRASSWGLVLKHDPDIMHHPRPHAEKPISGVTISPVLWNLTTPVFPETMPAALLRYQGQILVGGEAVGSLCPKVMCPQLLACCL